MFSKSSSPPTLTSFEPLDKLLNLSKDQCLLRIFVPTYFIGLFWELNEVIQVKNFLILSKQKYLVFTTIIKGRIPNDRCHCTQGIESWSRTLKSEWRKKSIKQKQARHSLPTDLSTPTWVSFHPRWNVCIIWVKIIIIKIVKVIYINPYHALTS